MVELVYTLVLEISVYYGRVGSTPAESILYKNRYRKDWSIMAVYDTIIIEGTILSIGYFGFTENEIETILIQSDDMEEPYVVYVPFDNIDDENLVNMWIGDVIKIETIRRIDDYESDMEYVAYKITKQ